MVDVPEHLELTAEQARVLGCLVEKQATTPDAYPLTLNALVTACNQTSNRTPVVHLERSLVESTVQSLKALGLARVVHPASGERATKYRHVVDEALGLDGAGRALLCVLLLRGPQTVTELRTRTERLHAFGGTAAVEDGLAALADHPRHLAERVPRGAGQREDRWRQLLAAEHDDQAVPAASAPTSVAPAAPAARPAVALPDSARAVVESGQLAHLVTVNRDGSPHVTVVWVGLDGDELVVGKLSEDQKVRNIRRDPRVSLSIEADGDQMGMRNYLVVEGDARLVPGGAPALLQELAHRYIGPDARFPPMPDPPEGYVIHITPTRVRGMGPWGIRF